MLGCSLVVTLLPASGHATDTATPGHSVPMLYQYMPLDKEDSVYAMLNLLDYLGIPAASTATDDLITGDQINDFLSRLTDEE